MFTECLRIKVMTKDITKSFIKVGGGGGGGGGVYSHPHPK